MILVLDGTCKKGGKGGGGRAQNVPSPLSRNYKRFVCVCLSLIYEYFISVCPILFQRIKTNLLFPQNKQFGRGSMRGLYSTLRVAVQYTEGGCTVH